MIMAVKSWQPSVLLHHVVVLRKYPRIPMSFVMPWPLLSCIPKGFAGDSSGLLSLHPSIMLHPTVVSQRG